MTNEQHFVTRREFTLEAALAMLAGVTITVTGCGGSSTPTGPSGQGGARVGTVATNHGHTATITSAQLTAGNALSLDIRGTADHPHTVALSQADLVQINAGTRVQRESSSDQAHTHFVAFN